MKEIKEILNAISEHWEMEVDSVKIAEFAVYFGEFWGFSITYNKVSKMSIVHFEHHIESEVSIDNLRGCILANI